VASNVLSYAMAEVAGFLQTQGCGTAVGDDIYFGFAPSDPDRVIVVTEYDAQPPERCHGVAGPYVEQPRFQVLVRDTDPTRAMETARRIWYLLDRITNESIGGSYYVTIRATMSPVPLHRDGNDRTVVVCNYQAQRRIE
jgi:hypothetical protein